MGVRPGARRRDGVAREVDSTPQERHERQHRRPLRFERVPVLLGAGSYEVEYGSFAHEPTEAELQRRQRLDR